MKQKDTVSHPNRTCSVRVQQCWMLLVDMEFGFPNPLVCEETAPVCVQTAQYLVYCKCSVNVKSNVN